MRAWLSLTAAACLLAACPGRARAGEGRTVKVALSEFNWKKYIGFSEWHGVYSNDQKCGYKHTEITLMKRGGKEVVRLRTEAHMKVKAMGKVAEMEVLDVREYSAADGRLVRIDVTAGTGLVKMRVTARPEGGKLACATLLGGMSTEEQLPLPGEDLLSALATHALIDRADAAVGDRIESEVFEAASKSAFRTVTIIRKKSATVLGGVPATVFDLEIQRFALPRGGGTVPRDAAPNAIETVTIDSTGRALKGSAMGRFSFRLESEADAKKMDKVSDIMLTTAVPLGRPIPGARSSRKAVLKLTGMPPGAIVNDSRQSFVERGEGHLLTLVALGKSELHPVLAGLLFVAALLGLVILAAGGLLLLGARSAADAARSRRMGIAAAAGGGVLMLAAGAVLFSGWTGGGGERVELTAGERAGYLAATAFLQSGDPRIRKLAAETVGDETDPYRAACRLNDWVYRHIRKEFTPAMSNALDTLKSRRGDCGEHAALFVALCRAAGVPAREVAGLAYTDAGGGILGGHAWAEVHVDGRWMAMDPTFGQKSADALHIKVAEGGMSDMGGMLRLAELMSKLKVEVISVE